MVWYTSTLWDDNQHQDNWQTHYLIIKYFQKNEFLWVSVITESEDPASLLVFLNITFVVQ